MAPALLCPFQAWTSRTIIRGWCSNLGTTGIGQELPSHLTWVSGLSVGFTALSAPCIFGIYITAILVIDLVTTLYVFECKLENVMFPKDGV